MGIEQRLYQRLAIDRPAQCAFSESFAESFPIVVADIGPEGIGFTARKRLAVGQDIFVDIDLGDGERPKLSAQVMWVKEVKGVRKFRVGAKVIDAQREDLEKFVRFYCARLIPIERTKKKILVVEDEMVMANLLELELKQAGYDVVCAHDGEDGFLKYTVEEPDLIILDIMLPKLDGYEVCRKIRREQNDNNTLILMLTAKSSDADRIVGGVIGAQKYITKPFEAEYLLEEIKKLLSSKKA